MYAVCKTDIGQVRSSNQDICRCGTFSDGGAWTVVCDGMGGVNGGNNPACGIMNFDANRITAYEDNVFAYIANAHVLNDGSVYISAATGESASAFYQLTGKAQ